MSTTALDDLLLAASEDGVPLDRPPIPMGGPRNPLMEVYDQVAALQAKDDEYEPGEEDERGWADKKKLSATRLKAIQECGEKARIKYDIPTAKRPPDPPTDALLVGSGAHAGAEFVNLCKRAEIDWSTDRAVGLIHETTMRRFRELIDEKGGVEGVNWTKGIRVEQAERLLRGCVNAFLWLPTETNGPSLAQRTQPIMVEESDFFEVPGAPGWWVEWKTDWTEIDSIWDLKNKSKAFYEREVHQDVQLSTYLYGYWSKYGKLLDYAAFANVIKPSIPKKVKNLGKQLPAWPPDKLDAYRVQLISTDRTMEDLEWYATWLTRVIDQIETGIYTHRPEHQFCGWCGFLEYCQTPSMVRRIRATMGDD